MGCSNIELANAAAGTVLPIALVPKFYTLDDLMSDMGHLAHLLDEATHGLNEQDYGIGPERNHGLDRISSMVHVARDMTERLNALLDVHYHQIGTTCASKKVSAQ